MGFERVLSVLQNKRSNYDTDLFVPLFKTIEAVSFVLNIRNSLVKNLVIYLELINCKLHDYREFLISLMNNTCREYSPLSKVYILVSS